MGMWQEMRQHPRRTLKFFVLMPTCLTGGMTLTIIGPTLLDLQQQVDTSASGIAFVLTARAVGAVIGSLACNYTYAHYNFLLTTVIICLMSAAATAVIGFLTSLWSLLLVAVLFGITFGCYEGNKMTYFMKLWGLESSPFIQLQSFVFGAGAFLAPAIAGPFLVNNEVDIIDESGKQLNVPEKTMLYIPYSIFAGIMVWNAVSIFCLWLFDPETTDHPSRLKDKKTDGDDSDLSSEQETSFKRWRLVVLALHAVGLHINFGVGLTMGQFLVAYVVKSPLHLPKYVGAQMTTMYYFLFTVKNLFAMAYIPYIGNAANIILSSTTVVFGSILLILYSQTSVVALWIGAAIVSFGDASVYPSALRFLEGFFPVTSGVGSLTVIAVVTGEFTLPALVSFVIEDYPQLLMWITFACAMTMILMYSLVITICHKKLAPARLRAERYEALD